MKLYTLPNGAQIKSGDQFELGDQKYPGGWLATAPDEVLSALGITVETVTDPEPEPVVRTVSSYRVVRRLEAAGLAVQALAVIDAPENAVLKARFYTLGQIPCDDSDAIALVLAAGGDPAEILAPE